MCNVWRSPGDELNTAGMFKIIDKLDKLGVVYIQLTGGEPFLRPDLAEIINYIKRKGLSVLVSTNGTLPLSVYEKVIKAASVDAIGVSLHSNHPKTQEKINGSPGSWGKTIKTIKFLRDKGENVYVCCVVSSLNLQEVPAIVKFCEDNLKVTIGLAPAVTASDNAYIFRGRDEPFKKLNYNEVREVIKRTRILSMRRTKTFMKNAFRVLAGQQVNWRCRAGRMFCAIMPDGRFGICQDILTQINILDDDFFEKINSREFKNKTANLVRACDHCVYSCYYDTTNMFARPWEALAIGARLMLFRFLR